MEQNGNYTSPNNSIIRSVKVIDEKIYTGCYMEFGYWKKTDSGSYQYNSLSNSPDIKLLEDEEFWKIIQLNEWVLFQSLNRIYIYNTLDKQFKIINSKTVLEKIFKINNTIYYQKNNDGLYKIEKGKSQLVSDDITLKKNKIVALFSHHKNLLLITQEQGFYTLDKNKLTKWKTNSDTLLSSISVYSCIKTSDNDFLLGTISHGVYQLDYQGNYISQIDQQKGLNNNTILNIFEDNNKNIWLGLDNGISCLNFNSPFKVYNDKNGSLGTTYTSIKHNETLYIGTNQGLFYKNINQRNDFKLIPETEGQVWSLKLIDNTLFCGHNLGTYIIKNHQAKHISNIPGTWKLEQFPFDKNKIIQGNYNGLSVLLKENNQWRFSHKIKGFENSSRYFEIINKNKIIVTHEHKGILQLTLDNSATNITKTTTNTTLKGEKSSFVQYQNEFFYFSANGVYKFNSKTNKFEISEFLNKNLRQDEIYNSGKLVNTNNKLWAFTKKNILIVSPGKLNDTPEISKVFLPVELRKNTIGFENISHLYEETYLFGTSFGYLLIDTEKLNSTKHQIQLNQITKRTLNGTEQIVSLNNNHTFVHEENNINFSYSVPNYDKYTEVSYQYILEGRHKHWSNWTEETTTSFKNLPFGDYTFKVKAKIGNTDSSNSINYNFTIERPWYLSNLLILLYVSLFILVILLIHSLNRRYYKRQKQEYLKKKQREFERSQLENEKEIMKLRNDKLRSDIESKSRELAASTMSIIKKNEFLNNIKNELAGMDDNDLIKPVIKIIDKNLNNNSNWTLFQEAFNNADKDFLKKVKNKYPQLTPNDLRLCAYLRLNLSSKEIAPLLNISHKSVEIKRYRLRKKIGLTKKENLIHHILEI